MERKMKIKKEVVGIVKEEIMVGEKERVIKNNKKVLRMIRRLRNRDGEKEGVKE